MNNERQPISVEQTETAKTYAKAEIVARMVLVGATLGIVNGLLHNGDSASMIVGFAGGTTGSILGKILTGEIKISR